MSRFTGFIGIFIILSLAYMMSNNRKAIDLKLVLVGLAMQWLFAFFILEVPFGKDIFHAVGGFFNLLLSFSSQGAEFVFGVLAKSEVMGKVFGTGSGFIFLFSVMPTIIFICALVGMLYHLGIMQKVVSFMAKLFTKLMDVSGAEALSNTASIFVGQVEAQIMIRPYVAGMTMSELLASMSGSMACISGGMMAIYIALGMKAEYLMAASLMAIPGSFVISKIVWPETEEPQTRGTFKLEVVKRDTNLIDAAAHGCIDGLHIVGNIIAMLMGFLALIALCNWFVGIIGGWLSLTGLNLSFIGLNLKALSLNSILGVIFAPIALAMGVPSHDIVQIGNLMGTKFVLNEVVSYLQLSDILHGHTTIHLAQKSITIVTFALCGFANLASVAMQIGGIGAIAPSRKHDLAKLGIKALICGTLASYMSAAIAGIILS